jgi:hypothetical protein
VPIQPDDITPSAPALSTRAIAKRAATVVLLFAAALSVCCVAYISRDWHLYSPGSMYTPWSKDGRFLNMMLVAFWGLIIPGLLRSLELGHAWRLIPMACGAPPVL